MKTILVIAQQPGLSSAIRAVLDFERYRVIQQLDIGEDVLIHPQSIDVCILDAELTSIQPIRMIERVRRRLPSTPIFVFAAAKQWEWEEEAYLLGVAHVLSKPVRGLLLNSLLQRLWIPAEAERARDIRAARAEARPEAKPDDTSRIPARALEILRDFSSILTHSLCAESLLKQFLQLLREILGVNRAAIFLRHPPGLWSDDPDPAQSRRLRTACALGLPANLLAHFELSIEAGIGGHVFKSGRILRRDSDGLDVDREIQKEFELLGAQVAIPILDRESFMGVAIFDGRVTGDALSNEELSLIFHLLEELGMAVKNIWLHDQIAVNHEMMSDILRQISSACVVVGRDLSVLHANEMARISFAPNRRSSGAIEFSDLPQVLGSKVFEVLKTGKPAPPFRYEGDRIYHVIVSPFQKRNSAVPNAAMLLMEDFTQAEHLQRLEVETANLRLVRQMAERLAHEIGNAIVPVSTHHQLLAERVSDPEFMASLDSALGDSLRRVSRLVNQMRFLAQDKLQGDESIPVKQLVEEAFREAQGQLSSNASLVYETLGSSLRVAGNRAGLQHALAEVILNALQAGIDSKQVQVRTSTEIDTNGTEVVKIEVQDSGQGFTREVAEHAQEPFFTTRNVGLGLGLAVTQKIIETHRGRLEIPVAEPGKLGVVRIALPVETVERAKPRPLNGGKNGGESR